MFHFGKKKASVPELVLSAENIELYRGPLSDIPLSEKTILATCMDLYKDPQPCYIHRGAAISSRKADRYDHKWHT